MASATMHSATLPKAEDFGRVGVFMGGWSAEREVSLNSGRAVLQGLLDAGVDAVGVDVERNTVQALRDAPYDRVFMILHGAEGENGTIQACLEMAGIPYTGSGVLASALAMDKLRSKCVWRALGLPTPEWRIVKSVGDCRRAAQALGLPIMIKPINEGSSVGISRVQTADEIERSFALAQGYGAVIAEQFIEGMELTVAIVDGAPLPVIHIETPHDFYDYEAKYLADSTHYHCPAAIPAALAQECQSLALQAYAALGCRDWGRVDFICDAQQQLWLIEANTSPGMTDHSLVPMAASQAGVGFSELLCRVLACTLSEGRQ